MTRHRLQLAVALALAASQAPTMAAQEPAQRDPPDNNLVHVFLDCHTRYCEFDHFRREIPLVNWVRDRRDADVHVLVTDQRTGGGGTEFTLAFIGLGRNDGQQYTLRHVSDANDTRAEVRDDLTRMLQAGLAPYVATTSAVRRQAIFYEAAGELEQIPTSPADDPWALWVFRIGVSGSVSGESQERFWRGNASISANRTTEAFKISLSGRANRFRSEFDVVDTTEGLDTTFVSERTFYGFDGVAAWSLGPHWSVGVLAEVDRASTINLDFGFRGGPALEYDIFPYAESTRRILTIRYVAGVAAFNYTEETIFDQTAEVRPAHMLEVDLGVQEPWGSIRAGIDGFQYLHDLSKHSIGVGGGFSVRLVRGLEFNMGGGISRIKDQLYLPKEDLTPEEVLLQRQERGTDFEYDLDIGLSFRFGSKFNNVVNPRMR